MSLIPTDGWKVTCLWDILYTEWKIENRETPKRRGQEDKIKKGKKWERERIVISTQTPANLIPETEGIYCSPLESCLTSQQGIQNWFQLWTNVQSLGITHLRAYLYSFNQCQHVFLSAKQQHQIHTSTLQETCNEKKIMSQRQNSFNTSQCVKVVFICGCEYCEKCDLFFFQASDTQSANCGVFIIQFTKTVIQFIVKW